MEQHKTELEQLQFSMEKLKIAHENYLTFSYKEANEIKEANKGTHYNFRFLNFDAYLKSALRDKHIFTDKPDFIKNYVIPHLPKDNVNTNE